MTEALEHSENPAFLETVLKTAAKTMLFFMAFLLMVLSVLSAALPNTARLYFSMGLYEKALSQSERDLSRKEKKLNTFYSESTEYRDYAFNEYLPALRRTVDYSIRLLTVKEKPKVATKVIDYITKFREKERIGFESYITLYNQQSLQSTRGEAMILVYDYNSHIEYFRIYAAMVLGDEACKERYNFTGLELAKDRVEDQLSQMNTVGLDVYTSGFLPDFAAAAYFDYLLKSVGFRYPARPYAITVDTTKAQMREYFQFSRFNYKMFSALLMESNDIYQFTDFYTKLNDFYTRLTEIITANKTGIDTKSPDDKLLYVWYVRTQHNITYSITSFFSVAYVFSRASEGVLLDNDFFNPAGVAFVKWGDLLYNVRYSEALKLLN